MKKLILGLMLLNLAAVEVEDKYQWLEQVESKSAMDWVKKENARTESVVLDKTYESLADQARQIYSSNERIPQIQIHDGMVYNLWQDKQHVKGIYRRSSLQDYLGKKENWEIVLDVDKLASDEKESWVFKGVSCLRKNREYCVVKLSRGGKDAIVIREFNLITKAFRANGFNIPESKSSVDWISADELLVSYAIGEESQTNSGYARTVKRWKRGQELATSPVVYAVDKADMVTAGSVSYSGDQQILTLVRMPDFFHAKISILSPENKIIPVNLPDDSEGAAVFSEFLVVKLRSDWQSGGKTYTEGTVIAVPVSEILAGQTTYTIKEIMKSSLQRIVSEFAVAKNSLYVVVLENVRSKILQFSWQNNLWQSKEVPLPQTGSSRIASSSEDEDSVVFAFESYLTPSSQLVFLEGKKMVPARQMPAFFETANLVEEQRAAISRDGTKIPYTIVYPKGMKLDGNNATLVNGYGGFMISLTPYYSPVEGKLWMEKGNVYVVANIRGGGEFGPSWHKAALKENRQRAYDDFIAVAEALIADKVTRPGKMAIKGGSNGGLLVGAVAMQRPDLYGAVICQIPLLDMIRYTQLPPGASWIGEYGDPADPQMRAVIEKYSPYQNVKSNVKYPSILFMTSTRDDRVHPGHARKMAAKMREMGHDIHFYENTEGGHGGGSDIEAKTKNSSMIFSYLYKFLK